MNRLRYARGLTSPLGGPGRRTSAYGYGRQSLYGYSGYGGGYGGCTACYEDPLTLEHTCQCHEAIEFLEAGRYLVEECDCLDCPFMGMSGYDSGFYGAGYGRYENTAFT